MTDYHEDETEKFYSSDEAGVKLGVSGSTVKRLAKTYKMSIYKPGKDYKFTEADIAEIRERSKATVK